ncbi:hypothetical protein GGX14DRAFT_580478 [Mycena pura]|uniref:Uncharacterized protein n=1 Tax=Mycena pura TaxID=153505 RepID=A0AAD6UKQ1_9AGAR|nr:hypothetical protein GGX14DRAFT_580478 [Mycena pura]
MCRPPRDASSARPPRSWALAARCTGPGGALSTARALISGVLVAPWPRCPACSCALSPERVRALSGARAIRRARGPPGRAVRFPRTAHSTAHPDRAWARRLPRSWVPLDTQSVGALSVSRRRLRALPAARACARRPRACVSALAAALVRAVARASPRTAQPDRAWALAAPCPPRSCALSPALPHAPPTPPRNLTVRGPAARRLLRAPSAARVAHSWLPVHRAHALSPHDASPAAGVRALSAAGMRALSASGLGFLSPALVRVLSAAGHPAGRARGRTVVTTLSAAGVGSLSTALCARCPRGRALAPLSPRDASPAACPRVRRRPMLNYLSGRAARVHVRLPPGGRARLVACVRESVRAGAGCVRAAGCVRVPGAWTRWPPREASLSGVGSLPVRRVTRAPPLCVRRRPLLHYPVGPCRQCAGAALASVADTGWLRACGGCRDVHASMRAGAGYGRAEEVRARAHARGGTAGASVPAQLRASGCRGAARACVGVQTRGCTGLYPVGVAVGVGVGSFVNQGGQELAHTHYDCALSTRTYQVEVGYPYAQAQRLALPSIYSPPRPDLLGPARAHIHVGRLYALLQLPAVLRRTRACVSRGACAHTPCTCQCPGLPHPPPPLQPERRCMHTHAERIHARACLATHPLPVPHTRACALALHAPDPTRPAPVPPWCTCVPARTLVPPDTKCAALARTFAPPDRACALSAPHLPAVHEPDPPPAMQAFAVPALALAAPTTPRTRRLRRRSARTRRTRPRAERDGDPRPRRTRCAPSRPGVRSLRPTCPCPYAYAPRACACAPCTPRASPAPALHPCALPLRPACPRCTRRCPRARTAPRASPAPVPRPCALPARAERAERAVPPSVPAYRAVRAVPARADRSRPVSAPPLLAVPSRVRVRMPGAYPRVPAGPDPVRLPRAALACAAPACAAPGLHAPAAVPRPAPLRAAAPAHCRRAGTSRRRTGRTRISLARPPLLAYNEVVKLIHLDARRVRAEAQLQRRDVDRVNKVLCGEVAGEEELWLLETQLSAMHEKLHVLDAPRRAHNAIAIPVCAAGGGRRRLWRVCGP